MNVNSRAVSAILGMILVLAVLASLVTVIVVYKLPVIEKRAEFRHELELLDRFFELQKAYYGKVCESFELGGGPTTYINTHESSALRVWKSGSVLVTVYYNGTSFTARGELFGFNMSIYPSKLPDFKAVVTPLGVAVYQGSFRLNVSDELNQFLNSSLLVNSTSVVAYVDSYSVNGHLKNFTVSGNGFASVKVFSEENPLSRSFPNATEVKFSVNSALFGHYTRTISVAGRNVRIIFRNYSVYVW